MMIQYLLPVLRKSCMVWLGILAGLSMIAACGGGGGGGTSPGSPDAPTVSIASPPGTYFKEGENIDFTGSATDSKGGPLTGSSLVWSSNIDGQIGTGETLITSVLTPGAHNISLKATDADGVAATATLPTITVAKTRFIKMGGQATDVSDASNAFDGDNDTAATLTTPDTEFIYFKAYLGTADTFIFKIRMGASTSGSKLSLQGLATNGAWQPVRDYDLDSIKTVSVKIISAQNYVDSAGYINLRVRWVGGAGGDNVPVYEIWRIDPVYSGPQTQGVIDPEAAFDGSTNTATSAKITNPWGAGGIFDYMHIKTYVGQSDSFIFNILTNLIADDQLLAIDIEASPGAWSILETLPLNSTTARTITIPNVQSYLDGDGYISLRARWVGYETGNSLDIYEISRIDPFVVGAKTSVGWVHDPENAVDGDLDTYAKIDYFWGEGTPGHNDFLHVKSYVGDSTLDRLSVTTDASQPGSDLIIEGELEPDNWLEIERINLDNRSTTTINMTDSRAYVDADGYISLRARWEADSPNFDAYVNEIRR